MAVIRIRPNGLSGGCAPSELARRGGKRGAVKGWSAAAAARNVAFLQSINPELLDGNGYAVTLTLGDTPNSADDWDRMRRRWLDRLRDAGMTRFHWVTEWTAKGRPHLHASVYGPERMQAKLLVAWLDIADSAGFPVSTRAQHIERIDGAVGWLKYVSKHASRGVVHYQRDGAPEGWEKTGRLWSQGGDWPIEEETEVELGSRQYVVFRSLVWDWMLRDMEARKVDPEFIEQTRARWAAPEHGAAHGVSGWIPGDIAYSFYLAAREAAPADHPWEN